MFLVTGRAEDMERMEDELAGAQVARISAEAALSSGLAAADDEAHALRQQLLSALQKARDAELRAADLQERNELLNANQQAGPDLSPPPSVPARNHNTHKNAASIYYTVGRTISGIPWQSGATIGRGGTELLFS